jgi:hypothetical protein
VEIIPSARITVASVYRHLWIVRMAGLMVVRRIPRMIDLIVEIVERSVKISITLESVKIANVPVDTLPP